jgi:hypothetical protein
MSEMGRLADLSESNGNGNGLAHARLRAAAEQQQSDTSTAADGPARGAGEPTRESDISAAVAELRNADGGTLRQVEPLARLLPRDRFEEVVETHRVRCLSSVIHNDAGFFVFLLRNAWDELRRETRAVAQPPETAVESGIERLKRDDPEEYARRMADHFERSGSQNREAAA